MNSLLRDSNNLRPFATTKLFICRPSKILETETDSFPAEWRWTIKFINHQSTQLVALADMWRHISHVTVQPSLDQQSEREGAYQRDLREARVTSSYTSFGWVNGFSTSRRHASESASWKIIRQPWKHVHASLRNPIVYACKYL